MQSPAAPVSGKNLIKDNKQKIKGFILLRMTTATTTPLSEKKKKKVASEFTALLVTVLTPVKAHSLKII